MRLAFDATALPPGGIARAAGPSPLHGSPPVAVTRVPTGAGRYILRLAQGLCRLPLEGRLFVFTRAEDVDRFGPWPPHAEPVPVRLATRPARLAWEQVGLPRALRRLNVDLLHSPHYTLPLGAVGVSRVVTFHDLTFFLAPAHHQPLKAMFFRRMIRASARRADLVVAVSQATADDAHRVLGLDRSRIAVVHEAARPDFAPVDDPARRAAVERRYGLRHPLLLSVGTIEPRKNLGASVRCVAALKARGIDCQLAVVGAKGWRSGPWFEEVRRSGLDDRVRVLGYVPDDDLCSLYSTCDAFLYPSLYEGFGLPALEAMACGAPVIVADRSSMPEVVGAGGLRYDPDDEGGLADLVGTLLLDEVVRREWRRRATERAEGFTWERAARETYEWYRRVLARKRG
jgi:glycosyltransferase involved in cell wall biosynthesis